MANISKVNGLDFDQETLEDLQLLLKNELYIDIDSPFAEELMTEINRRQELLQEDNG
jgi:hypothetical protein